MKTTNRNLGLTLLAIWLIVTGISPFLTIAIPYRSTLLAILAVVAGILLLFDRG